MGKTPWIYKHLIFSSVCQCHVAIPSIIFQLCYCFDFPQITTQICLVLSARLSGLAYCHCRKERKWYLSQYSTILILVLRCNQYDIINFGPWLIFCRRPMAARQWWTLLCWVIHWCLKWSFTAPIIHTLCACYCTYYGNPVASANKFLTCLMLCF